MADGSQRWHRFLHLCLPWPGATVRTKTTVLVVIAVLAVILFFNGFSSYRADLDPAHKARVVEHLREFLGQGLTTLVITPDKLDELAGADFRYVITDRTETAIVSEAALNVDFGAPSGHSGPVWEAVIVLENDITELRYRASVHIYEPDDLFLSTSFLQLQEDGRYHADDLPKPVRVPGIGRLLMHLGPEACRSQFRDNCYSGELDIDFTGD
jgi:hypothetical protein